MNNKTDIHKFQLSMLFASEKKHTFSENGLQVFFFFLGGFAFTPPT
jgi:hypothetical protein